VGQGAFYTEVFAYGEDNTFTMVYDCGTETATADLKIPLERQIDDFKKGIKQIDLLFISHLHKDHISGIDRLLDGIKVCKTIIPMLPEEVVTLARVQNFLHYGQDAEGADRVITELYLSNQRSGRFGQVVAIEPFDYSDYRGSITIRGNGNRERNLHPITGIDEKYWEYIPFNSVACKDKRAIDFYKKLQKIPEVFDTNGELNTTKILKGCRKKVRSLYHSIMRNQDDNLYTLAVESHPVQDAFPDSDNKDLRRSRCLYTGDLDLNVKDEGVLLGRFNSWVDYLQIGTVQVPHHGSRHNWTGEFLKGEHRQFFISSGSTNTYHHPDYWVTQGIKEQGNKLAVVTEDDNSEMKQVFGLFSGRIANPSRSSSRRNAIRVIGGSTKRS
jgi:hypothetical protein